mgnify:CR=1 FL=1
MAELVEEALIVVEVACFAALAFFFVAGDFIEIDCSFSI